MKRLVAAFLFVCALSAGLVFVSPASAVARKSNNIRRIEEQNLRRVEEQSKQRIGGASKAQNGGNVKDSGEAYNKARYYKQKKVR